MVALEGLEVTHKVFGNGIVEKVKDKYVTVRFANLNKTFVYPDAFNGFLQAADETVAAQIAEDLAEVQAKRAAHEAELAKEREVQMRAGTVIAGAQSLTTEPATDYTPVPEDGAED